MRQWANLYYHPKRARENSDFKEEYFKLAESRVENFEICQQLLEQHKADQKSLDNARKELLLIRKFGYEYFPWSDRDLLPVFQKQELKLLQKISALEEENRNLRNKVECCQNCERRTYFSCCFDFCYSTERKHRMDERCDLYKFHRECDPLCKRAKRLLRVKRIK